MSLDAIKERQLNLEAITAIVRTHGYPNQTDDLYHFLTDEQSLIEALENDSLDKWYLTGNPHLWMIVEHRGSETVPGRIRPLRLRFTRGPLDYMNLIPVFYIIRGVPPTREILDYYQRVGACDWDPQSCDKDKIASIPRWGEVGFIKGEDFAPESEWVTSPEFQEISGDLWAMINEVTINRRGLAFYLDDDYIEAFTSDLERFDIDRSKVVVIN